jgi:hypothetical protein
MGGIHNRVERPRHRMAVHLANGSGTYTAIHRDGFDIDTPGQIPCDCRMPQSVLNDFHLGIIGRKPGFVYNRIPALPEAADGPSVIFDDRMPADAKALPAPHMGQQTGRDWYLRLSLTCFLFVVWPALEDTTFEIGIAASDGWDNGCTADVTSPAAGVETNKNKPCNVARCIITDPPATEYGFSFLPPCCTIVPPHHGLTNALGLPVHRVIRD